MLGLSLCICVFVNVHNTHLLIFYVLAVTTFDTKKIMYDAGRILSEVGIRGDLERGRVRENL